MRQTDCRLERLANQEGVALLTVLLLLMVMTVIGIASITITALENRLAGFVRTGEAASVAAEACLSTAKITIEQAISNGTVPAALLSNANPPGPVPQGNKATLDSEIIGAAGFENFNDVLPAAFPNFNLGVPSPTQTLNNFVVQGDIDRLYAQAKSGSGMEANAGYAGTGTGAASGGVDILYQINCLATNAATNSKARITAIYACTATAESCQRKI
jgi:Tfp pilus assembly protein PilX